MNSKIKLTVTFIALAAVIVIAVLLYDSFADSYKPDNLITDPPQTSADSEGETAKQTTAAPNFTVLSWEGEKVSLADFAGRPVILNFWASWCGPCKNEMPDFDEAYKKYGEEITFMMINLSDGRREIVDTAKAFIKDQGFTFPVYFDTELSASSAYYTASNPVTYFIDKEGNLVTRAIGMIDADTLEKGIGMIK